MIDRIGRNDVGNLKIFQTQLFSVDIHYLLFFLSKLLIIIQLLEGTTAAILKMWARCSDGSTRFVKTRNSSHLS